jgi:hypothetical protein
MAKAEVNTSADVCNPALYSAEPSLPTELLGRFITALRLAIWHQRRADLDAAFAPDARSAWATVTRSAASVLKSRGNLDEIAYGLVVLVDAAVEMRQTDLAANYLSLTVESLSALAGRVDVDEIRMRLLIDALMIEVIRLSELWPDPEAPLRNPAPSRLPSDLVAKEGDPAPDLPLNVALAAAAPEHAPAH